MGYLGKKTSHIGANKRDPLYAARRTVHGSPHRQAAGCLDTLFSAGGHVEAQATWGTYQRITAYRRSPADTENDQLCQPRRAQAVDRDQDAPTNRETSRHRHPGLRPVRHIERSKRSIVVSNICPAPLSDAATSPTKSPEVYLRPGHLDPNYTADCEDADKSR